MIMRIAFLSLLSIALLGCGAAQDVELEGRDFTVQQNATPSAAGAGIQNTEQMARLVSQSGPTYVTLVVSDVDKQTASRPSEKRDTPVTSGSGFLVDSSGYVMTAAHVAVKSGNSVSARAANGKVYSGQVVGILPGNDMALIKLRGYMGKVAMPAANHCLPAGSMVYSLGKPHAQGDTARIGKVQSMHFGHTVSYGKFGYPDAIVLNMGTQKGESGGPLFNQSGELVGMVVSTLTDANGNLVNMAHAIPVSALAHFYCSKAQCTGPWATLSQSSTDSCGNI